MSLLLLQVYLDNYKFPCANLNLIEDQKPSYMICFISMVTAPLFHQSCLDAVAEEVEKQHHGGRVLMNINSPILLNGHLISVQL